MATRMTSRVMISVLAVTSLYGGGEQSRSLDERLAKVVIESEAQGDDETQSSSEGIITAKQLANRPLLRPAEVLESVPGLIVTQHSGDGKANQYFLRGFSLDHGTDFATTVEGMPTNLPAHAHGQGYNDLNFLIPELISSVTYTKGPYFASQGDFASTGSAAIAYAKNLPYGLAMTTVGANGYHRFLNAQSMTLRGGTLLYALEYFHHDGPWDKPEGYKRLNGVISYAKDEGKRSYSLTAMGYDGSWNATNHVPLRAIEHGVIGRYGTLDASDGGSTHRYSLSGQYTQRDDDHTTKMSAYAIAYGLDLFSNFTYYLDHPNQGDQFEQKESRNLIGGEWQDLRSGMIGGKEVFLTYGLQVRHDSVNVALYHTQNRERFDTLTHHGVSIRTGGAYVQSELHVTPRFRIITGLRGDSYRFDVKDNLNDANSGDKTASLLSPKVSFIVGVSDETEMFINGGYGLHSNDARGVTKAQDPVTPLVRTKGGEIGFKNRSIRGLQSALSLWMMDSDSELVFAGDTGNTEPTGAARRVGVEWANYWTPLPWLIIDADLAFSKARYTGANAAGQRYVPEAMEQTFSMGGVVTGYEGWFGGARLRYFGSRALIEDNSQRSAPSTLVNLKVGKTVTKNLDVVCDVYNLFDRKTYDIQYYYESKLATESTPVADHMVHPGEPRSVRLTLRLKY